MVRDTQSTLAVQRLSLICLWTFSTIKSAVCVYPNHKHFHQACAKSWAWVTRYSNVTLESMLILHLILTRLNLQTKRMKRSLQWLKRKSKALLLTLMILMHSSFSLKAASNGIFLDPLIRALWDALRQALISITLKLINIWSTGQEILTRVICFICLEVLSIKAKLTDNSPKNRL